MIYAFQGELKGVTSQAAVDRILNKVKRPQCAHNDIINHVCDRKVFLVSKNGFIESCVEKGMNNPIFLHAIPTVTLGEAKGDDLPYTIAIGEPFIPDWVGLLPASAYCAKYGEYHFSSAERVPDMEPTGATVRVLSTTVHICYPVYAYHQIDNLKHRVDVDSYEWTVYNSPKYCFYGNWEHLIIHTPFSCYRKMEYKVLSLYQLAAKMVDWGMTRPQVVSQPVTFNVGVPDGKTVSIRATVPESRTPVWVSQLPAQLYYLDGVVTDTPHAGATPDRETSIYSCRITIMNRDEVVSS